jgi:hypothetical protein
MNDFKAQNDCNFKTVFSELVRENDATSFRPKRSKATDSTGNLQAFERVSIFWAAKLYVHRRDQSDASSLTTGIGMLLETCDRLYGVATAPILRTVFWDIGESGECLVLWLSEY